MRVPSRCGSQLQRGSCDNAGGSEREAIASATTVLGALEHKNGAVFRVVKSGVSGRNMFSGSGINQRAGSLTSSVSRAIVTTFFFSLCIASYGVITVLARCTVQVEFIGPRNSSTILSCIAQHVTEIFPNPPRTVEPVHEGHIPVALSQMFKLTLELPKQSMTGL